MSANLLVELFVEELPPKALKTLGESFAAVLADSLKAQSSCLCAPTCGNKNLIADQLLFALIGCQACSNAIFGGFNFIQPGFKENVQTLFFQAPL